MNKVKSILTVAALAMGLGIGFGVAVVPAQAQQGVIECAYDYQCDARCGAVGAGACTRGRCGCYF